MDAKSALQIIVKNEKNIETVFNKLVLILDKYKVFPDTCIFIEEMIIELGYIKTENGFVKNS